jgi:hypothetical protein
MTNNYELAVYNKDKLDKDIDWLGQNTENLREENE